MNKYKIFIITLLTIFLTSCTDNKDNNSWIVATSADNPPYEYMSNGKIVGFDIDVMNEIGKYLGKKIEFKDVEFPGLLAALTSNNVDMTIAAISITEKRQAKVDFSIPYIDARIALLYRKNDEFRSPEDLRDKIVGTQLGTIWTSIAQDLSSEYGFSNKSLTNNLTLVQELQNKRIDAVIMEESQVKKFIEKHPDLASFSVEQYDSSFAIAMPKNSGLKTDIDKAIKELKNNGTISFLAKKWSVKSAQ